MVNVLYGQTGRSGIWETRNTYPYVHPSSCAPVTVVMVSSVTLSFCATSATNPVATTNVFPMNLDASDELNASDASSDASATSPTTTSPTTLTSEYSNASFTATAAFAGMVHGVVVHTAKEADANSSLNSNGKASETDFTGNATYTDCDVCPSGYSSSASASAVIEDGLQCTGFFPL